MPFKPGKSGNVAGRPKNAKPKQSYRHLFLEHAEELIAQVIELARQGDRAAIKLCIERITPPLKNDGVVMPTLGTGTLQQQGNDVLQAIGNGDIEAGTGAALMSALQLQAKLEEITDMGKRLDALEKSLGNGH